MFKNLETLAVLPFGDATSRWILRRWTTADCENPTIKMAVLDAGPARCDALFRHSLVAEEHAATPERRERSRDFRLRYAQYQALATAAKRASAQAMFSRAAKRVNNASRRG